MLIRDSSSPSISCVVPAFNEARSLAALVDSILQTLARLSEQVELIVVDDGSRDNTASVMQDLCSTYPQVVYLKLSRNFGKEPALTAGIEAARGDVVILMDGDGQHPVSLVPDMLAKWREGSDVVYAVRRTRADQSGLQIKLTAWFYKLVNLGNRVQIPANAGDFRLMDRKVVEALKRLTERNRFMKGLYAWVGFKTAALPFVPQDRAAGASSFNLRRLGSLALLGLTSFTTQPLRVSSVMGSAVALLALAYGAWILLDTVLFGVDLAGWPTLAAGIMLFSGVQLMSIGILGEYIGRIYDEVKQRPSYLVARDEDHSPWRGGQP